MHEVGIMKSAIDAAAHKARENGAVQVHRVVLRVGALSGVEKDALLPAFDAVARGTPAAGAELFSETAPDSGRCPEYARGSWAEGA